MFFPKYENHKYNQKFKEQANKKNLDQKRDTNKFATNDKEKTKKKF